MTLLPTDLQAYWVPLAPFFALRNETDYDSAVARLNALIDEVGTNEQHPLYGMLDTLGAVIHSYELHHHEIIDAPATDVLQYLLEERGLKASDLSELGTATDAEAVVSGAKQMTADQIRALAVRFHVSPAVLL